VAEDLGSPVSWLAQTLRASFFLAQPLTASASVWRALTGKEPEADENRPRQGSRQQSGEWDGVSLVVNVSDPRIDILITPILTASIEGLAIGSFPEQSSKFVGLVSKWLQNADIQCIRIAIGALLWMPTASLEEAYQRLDKLVPSVSYDAENAREVTYRVNRPRKSSVNGMRVNRITTWSSITLQRSFAAAEGQPFQKTDQNYVSLECDHNTEQSRTDILPAPERVPLLQELFDLVGENARKGELA